MRRILDFMVCEKKYCTGCKLCFSICPKKCISFKEDELGAIYPVIDKNKCVNCGLCKKVCPSLNENIGREPLSAYAAFSNDLNVRNKGASGGIAREIYDYALKLKYSTYGVVFDLDKGAIYKKITSVSELDNVQNSKYVYSDLESCLDDIKNDIFNNKRVLFIGLSCQVAAVKMLFKRYQKDKNLISVDIVCHGVVPKTYLMQHIMFLEHKYKKKVKNISFRNHDSKYYFCLYDENNNCFYKKKPNESDLYYRGFMNNLILRENCYNCRYANKKRISDITIGDYDEKNELPISLEDKNQVSLVLINTLDGENIINYLKKKKRIITIKQVFNDAIKFNRAFHYPANKHLKRLKFENYYKETSNFEFSVKKSLAREMLIYKIMFVPNCLKIIFLKLFPKSFKNSVKKIIRNLRC